ncbi:hypothetical protein [Chryseobacterium sp. MMS23-Vi53]|uniref:hypothetical protein n=1 Tax=Chryseobacterium sp. MMS23-Vi53 TaxID=3386644 RepID=UPI0039EC6061
MKFLNLAGILLAQFFFSQTGNVGINTSNPDNSAILHIENFSGTQATATATISGGVITAISINNGGSGYQTAPTVNFYGGGAIVNGGAKARATATITNGVVTGITINNGGSGYTSVPKVVLSGGNKGLLLPNLNLTSLTSTTTPVASPADGLLAYNGGTNSNNKAIHFFNSTNSQWQSSIYAEDTPKVAYVTLTGSLALLDNAIQGVSARLLQNPLAVSAVSNISGFKVVPYDNAYDLVLPQGNYLVEINLNLNSPQENPSGYNGTAPLSGSTYYLMGYFMDFYGDTYNNSTGTFTAGSNIGRKEIPIVSKVNTNHLATWSLYYNVPANANANIIGGLRLYLGRMQGSTFYDLVNVISDESYIKISKL